MENLKVGAVLKSLVNGKTFTIADVKEERLSADEIGKVALVVDKETTAIYWIPFSRFVESKFEVVKWE